MIESELRDTNTLKSVQSLPQMPTGSGLFGKKQDDIIRQKKEDLAEKMKLASAEIQKNDHKDNQESNTAPNVNFTFTQLELETAWYDYISQLDKGSLSFMKERKVVLQENTNVSVVFANNHERSLFEEYKLNGLQYLRVNLKNTEISLNFEIDTTLVPEQKSLSVDEKFNKMVAQNPHLASLRQLLELEIDY